MPDWWGNARNEAIADWGRAANRAMGEGGFSNRVKSALYGVGEAAAEYAPKSAPGAALELATAVTPFAIARAARSVGPMIETVKDLRLASRMIGVEREVAAAKGITSLASRLGGTQAARVLASAGHAAAEMAHAGSSIVHSAHALIKSFEKAPAATVVSRSRMTPQVEQGIVHQGGMVEFPRSRLFVMPPIPIKASAHPHAGKSAAAPAPSPSGGASQAHHAASAMKAQAALRNRAWSAAHMTIRTQATPAHSIFGSFLSKRTAPLAHPAPALQHHATNLAFGAPRVKPPPRLSIPPSRPPMRAPTMPRVGARR